MIPDGNGIGLEKKLRKMGIFLNTLKALMKLQTKTTIAVMAKASLRLQQAFNMNNEAVSYVRR